MSSSRQSRIDSLRDQAQRAMAELGPKLLPSATDGMDLPHLIEELRIYHEELEIQNDELSVAHTRADAARTRYQLLFSVLPMPALVVDVFGVVVEDNDSSQDWLGPSRKYQHHDLRFSQSLHRHDRPRLSRLLSSLEPMRKGLLTNLSLTTFDQKERQVDAHIARLPQDFHEETRFLVVLLDRSLESARLAEQGLFNALLDSSDDLIYATDAIGRIMLANSVFLGVLGLTRDRVLGRKLAEFWPTASLAPMQATEEQVRLRGQPLNTTETVQWHSGQSPMALAVRKFPIRNRKGECIGVASVCRDITAEQNQIRTQRMAELAFIHLPMAAAVTDREGRLLKINGAMEKLCGFLDASLHDRSLYTLFHKPLPDWGYQDVCNHLLDQGQWEGFANLRRSDGFKVSVKAAVSRMSTPEDHGFAALWLITALPDALPGGQSPATVSPTNDNA